MKDSKEKTETTSTLASQIWNKLKDLPMPIFGIPRNLSDTFLVKSGHPDILCLTSNIPAAVFQLEELINTFVVQLKAKKNDLNPGPKNVNVFDFNVNKEYINISVNKDVFSNPKLKKQFDQLMKTNWIGASVSLKQKSNTNV